MRDSNSAERSAYKMGESQKIVITGCNGLLGQTLLRKLEGTASRVYGVDLHPNLSMNTLTGFSILRWILPVPGKRSGFFGNWNLILLLTRQR